MNQCNVQAHFHTLIYRMLPVNLPHVDSGLSERDVREIERIFFIRFD